MNRRILPAVLLTESSFEAGSDFTEGLNGPNSWLDRAKQCHLFQGACNRETAPTNAEILEEMRRLELSVYRIQDIDPAFSIPRHEQWLANYRSDRRGMSKRHAFLLAASFGLTIGAFSHKSESVFKNNIAPVALHLRKKGLNMADASFEVLANLFPRDKLGSIEVLPLVSNRAPGQRMQAEMRKVDVSIVKAEEYIRFIVNVPDGFAEKFEVILFEQDAGGGVYCYSPSCAIQHRFYHKNCITLPVEDDPDNRVVGEISFGTLGTSKILAILNSGPRLNLPKDWFGPAKIGTQNVTNFPLDASNHLEAFIEMLAAKPNSEWLAITHDCIVE